MDNLKISSELTEKQIDQLIEFTNSDPNIKKFTMDLERFKTKEAYFEWLKRVDPTILCLSDQDGNLAGIAWFNKKAFPNFNLTTDINPKDYEYTNGVRIYGKFRGQGLSVPFYKMILEKCPGKSWNLISEENIPSVKLHQKLGFTQVSNTENGKILMVQV